MMAIVTASHQLLGACSGRERRFLPVLVITSQHPWERRCRRPNEETEAETLCFFFLFFPFLSP